MVRPCWSREAAAAAAAARRIDCCAHGGGGGGLVGGNGSAPGLETPVDIAPYNARRHEHSRPPPSYADLLRLVKKPDPKYIRL